MVRGKNHINIKHNWREFLYIRAIMDSYIYNINEIVKLNIHGI